MATFIVKTMDDRNLFLGADHFRLDAQTDTYTFYNDADQTGIVASLPVRNVFVVIDDDAFEGDFYARAQYDDIYDEDPPIEEDEP